MADYGNSDTSTTSLGTNQFPISEVYVPSGAQTAAAGGTLTALEGGPASTDSASPAKRSAPASMYVKDGSDVAQGTTTDSPNANTVVGQLKQIQTNTNGGATAANQTTANTSLSSVATNTSNTATNTSNINTATGTKTDSKATDGSVTAWSVIALLKGIIDKLLSTLAVTQSGTWTVQPGNTANITAWKVDGSGVTQPVSGSVSVSNFPGTQPVSGTVTANAGTGNMGSNLTQVAGNSVAVGNNAVPVLNSAATGYVAAFGSNAAALTSATDYSFKWGAGGTTQVNHILLQNNTASSLNWDLDVAATGGSPTLAAGQTLFLDVQTSTLHLFQAGTPNVNGTASGNIAVRGWL